LGWLSQRSLPFLVFLLKSKKTLSRVQSMPEATGAVAAGAVADCLLGPKERKKLAIILVIVHSIVVSYSVHC
jgi:hypothetical protein